MDYIKIGNLICQLRKERGFTQQQIADALNITNKTVSKWERGLGCPDVSLLNELSVVLGADLSHLLDGRLIRNQQNTGDMRKVHFYVCPVCGNILTSTGPGNLVCCSRKLTPLVPQMHLEDHSFSVEEIDLDYYISSTHPMDKEHYISFFAFIGTDKIFLQRLYPEQACEIRLPLSFHKGIIFAYCTEHGLWAVPFQR
jgi:desulfoferrodoxin